MGKPSDDERTRPEVLADHKRVGKRLVPPLIHRLPATKFVETSWQRVCVPELIWLNLVMRGRGFSATFRLADALAKAAYKSGDPTRWFGTVSSFSQLSASERASVRKDLSDVRVLEDLQVAMAPLLRLYPECPLRLLFDEGADLGAGTSEGLDLIRKSLRTMLDKYSKMALRIQVVFILFGFARGMMRVRRGLRLAEIPTANGLAHLMSYPETEDSRALASVVFSMIPQFFVNPAYDAGWDWPAYFWNRGLELEPCTQVRDDS